MRATGQLLHSKSLIFQRARAPFLSPICSMVKHNEPPDNWKPLNIPAEELQLEFTLPTGQSFRWRQTLPDEYTGVIGKMLVKLRQTDDDVLYHIVARTVDATDAECLAVLQEYLNLHLSLTDISKAWCSKDARFSQVKQYIPGARVLRQHPVECLFQFICSSNNHISRIHGMVERLCKAYGTPIHTTQGTPDTGAAEGLSYYSFPSLHQLATATEEQLRADGFGYRAKFIVDAVALLHSKPQGGESWLLSLRDVAYQEAAKELCTLPGVGPKVAACVCLFSLDKHEAIPVDTHVWELATRYYTPQLKGKSLTKRIMEAVEAELIHVFGPCAGWAHNTLFISELASVRATLPPHLFPKDARAKGTKAGKSASKRKAKDGGNEKKHRAAISEGSHGKTDVETLETSEVKYGAVEQSLRHTARRGRTGAMSKNGSTMEMRGSTTLSKPNAGKMRRSTVKRRHKGIAMCHDDCGEGTMEEEGGTNQRQASEADASSALRAKDTSTKEEDVREWKPFGLSGEGEQGVDGGLPQAAADATLKQRLRVVKKRGGDDGVLPKRGD